MATKQMEKLDTRQPVLDTRRERKMVQATWLNLKDGENANTATQLNTKTKVFTANFKKATSHQTGVRFVQNSKKKNHQKHHKT